MGLEDKLDNAVKDAASETLEAMGELKGEKPVGSEAAHDHPEHDHHKHDHQNHEHSSETSRTTESDAADTHDL